MGRSSQGRRNARGFLGPVPSPTSHIPSKKAKPSLTPEVLGGSEKRKEPTQEPSRSEGGAGQERGQEGRLTRGGGVDPGTPVPQRRRSGRDLHGGGGGGGRRGGVGGGPTPCSVFPGGVVVVLVLVVEGRGVCE